MTKIATAGPAQPSIHQLPLRASLAAVFLCSLFGANPTAVKFSLAGMGSFTTAGCRFGIAALTLVTWSVIRKKPLALNRTQLLQMIRLSVIFVLQLSCFYQGMTYTTASHGALISNLLPFIVLVLAHFFIPGDTITTRKALGIGLGFAGVVFLLFDPGEAGTAMYRGDLFVLCAITLWGINGIYVKRIIKDYDPVQITVYPMIFTVPLFFMLGALWDEPMITAVTPSVVAGLVYQSLVTASFGFVTWNILLQRYGASALHSFVFISPISGVLAGVLLLGEPVTLQLITAILLIAGGILIVHLHLPRRPAVPPRSAPLPPP